MTEEFKLETNIIDEDTTKERIKHILNFLSNTLSKTLGPYGSTTLIQDRESSYMSKDGFTVLDHIQIKDDLSKTILTLIKKISKELVRSVGDGSTSSIIISAKLYEELNTFIKEFNIPSKDILELLNIISDKLVNDIISQSTKIDDKELSKLKDIAAVSLNNDEKLGKLIYDMYTEVGKYGYITIENGKDKDEYKITNGATVKRGFIDFRFANDSKKLNCIYEHPFVFMVNDQLVERDMELLLELIGQCMSIKKPLIIVAKGYDIDIKNFLSINKLQNKDEFEVCAIDYAIASAYHLDCFEDLAILLGCDYWNKADNEVISKFDLKRCGSCEKVIISDSTSQFIKGKGSKEKINARYKEILNEYEEDSKLENINNEYLIKHKKRMATLSNSMAIFYVGGESDVERTTKKFLVEDAIYACQSAIENGYISGGNLIVSRIISNNDKYTEYENLVKEYLENKIYLNKSEIDDCSYKILELISNSFIHSFITVLNNAKIDKKIINEIIDTCIYGNTFYNLKTHQYEDISTTKIINSAETDIQIIKSAFSIIGLLVTSNQYASFNYILS